MTDMVRIEGGRKIALVAAALRRMGDDRTIVNNMTKRIRKSSPALRKAIKDSARKNLPRGGGLNRWVAAANIRTQVLRSSRHAGVRLIVGRDSLHGRSDLRRIDAGTVRHPLYGNRKRWYPQSITPGFATNVMHGEAADQFRRDALDAIDDSITEVLRGF